jgi:ferric-dicitrate binding protein FerR (iron transport regulator)
MTVKFNNKERTDAAWNKLYRRLENDGLLAGERENSVAVPFIRSMAFRIAAGIVILAGVVTLLTFGGGDKPVTLLSKTNPGGETTVATTLEDGSTVFLASNATISYPEKFSKDRREVKLSGNAYFEVTKREGKPFIVETDIANIEVLGTSFNVMITETEVPNIAVNTGLVRVTHKSTGETILVKAGESVMLASETMKRMTTNDFDQFKKYLQRVHFKDERLSDVVRIINRNSNSLIIELDPAIGNRLITATFSGNSPDTMARLICTALNLKYKTEETRVLIHE